MDRLFRHMQLAISGHNDCNNPAISSGSCTFLLLPHLHLLLLFTREASLTSTKMGDSSRASTPSSSNANTNTRPTTPREERHQSLVIRYIMSTHVRIYLDPDLDFDLGVCQGGQHVTSVHRY
ncbi:hypothetical protein Hamer_G001872 [Homarus americanus]|uniref:Uncharacterized protein n=1 Tax=Homarus americanus TaxID=6706 RepID=A0A8J5MQW9_HOMAM|nr:hypothetical protein Hamer_G001872 [Homarus americanus]